MSAVALQRHLKVDFVCDGWTNPAASSRMTIGWEGSQSRGRIGRYPVTAIGAFFTAVCRKVGLFNCARLGSASRASIKLVWFTRTLYSRRSQIQTVALDSYVRWNRTASISLQPSLILLTPPLLPLFILVTALSCTTVHFPLCLLSFQSTSHNQNQSTDSVAEGREPWQVQNCRPRSV